MCQERLLSIKKESCFPHTRTRRILRERVVVVATSPSISSLGSNSNSSFSDSSSPPSSPLTHQEHEHNRLTNQQRFAIPPRSSQQFSNPQVRPQENAPPRPTMQQLRSQALLELALRTVMLVKTNKLIQKQIEELQRETAEYVRMVSRNNAREATKPQTVPVDLSK